MLKEMSFSSSHKLLVDGSETSGVGAEAAADAFEAELEGSWELESLRLVWGGSFL